MTAAAYRRRLARIALAAGVAASAAPSKAEDFFTSVQRAFGVPVAEPFQPVPSSVSSAATRLRPRPRARLAGRPHYASLAAPGFAVVTSPAPHAPDLSGTIDPSYAAEEAKAFAGAQGGRRETGWMAGRQTMCVRLCDGYAFPVGRLGGTGDLPLHKTACEAACPGAATVLFSRPEGAEGLEAAVSVGGRPYGSLRTAYAYRQRLVPACGCHAVGERAYTPLPLNRDRTLRAGDVVMGKTSGFVLLAGRVPAFEDYRSSGALTRAERLRMQAVIGTEAPHPALRVQLAAQGEAAPGGPREPAGGPLTVRVVLPRPY